MSLDRPLFLRAILSYLLQFFGPVFWEYYIQPYLVEQLKTYKKTGYFEGEKPPTGLRNLLDRLYFKIVAGCKSGGSAGVILLAANINSAHCDVSYNVAQVVEDGEHPTIKVSDQTGKHDKSFDDEKLTVDINSFKVTYGKNWDEKRKKHFQQMRQESSNLGLQIPQKLKDSATEQAQKDMIQKIVSDGEPRLQKYMTIEGTLWSKLGDSIVITKDHEFITYLGSAQNSDHIGR